MLKCFNFHLPLFAMAVNGSCLCSCAPFATRADVADSAARISHQVHNTRTELGEQHLAMSIGDAQTLRELVQASRRESEAALMSAQRAASDAQRASLDLRELAGAALVAGDLATGGRVSLVLDAAQNRAVREIAQVRHELDTHAYAAGARLNEHVNAVRERLNERIDQWIEKVNYANTRIDSIDATMKAKFASLDSTHVHGMTALFSDEAAFRAYVRESTRLAPDEIAQLDRMSPEQILSLVLASTAAAGVGGMLGRTGKSRAQPQIDALKARLEH